MKKSSNIIWLGFLLAVCAAWFSLNGDDGQQPTAISSLVAEESYRSLKLNINGVSLGMHRKRVEQVPTKLGALSPRLGDSAFDPGEKNWVYYGFAAGSENGNPPFYTGHTRVLYDDDDCVLAVYGSNLYLGSELLAPNNEGMVDEVKSSSVSHERDGYGFLVVYEEPPLVVSTHAGTKDRFTYCLGQYDPIKL